MKNVFIVLSGGPGTYDPMDRETHDQSWDNFVTPPLLRSSKAPIHDAKTEEVHWLIYEPAYTARWASDVANQKTAPAQHQHTVNIKTKYKLPNYLELLKKRATERGWKYQGISSASKFLTYVSGLKGTKISRMWFFGHARDDLWLSLDHRPQDHEAIQPESAAVLNVADIDKLKAFSFIPQKTVIFPHKFLAATQKPSPRNGPGILVSTRRELKARWTSPESTPMEARSYLAPERNGSNTPTLAPPYDSRSSLATT